MWILSPVFFEGKKPPRGSPLAVERGSGGFLGVWIFVGREGQRTLVIAALQDKETQMAEISANAATGCFLGRCGDWIGGTKKQWATV